MLNIFIIIGPCVLKNAVEQNKAERSDRAGMDLQGVDSRGQRGPSEKVTLEGVKKVRVLNIWGKIIQVRGF